MVTFFRLACSVVLWGGRNTANKYHWCVLTVIQPHWVCPRSLRVCFTSLHCSGSRLLCWELSDAGPRLHALPRSSHSGSGSWVLHKGIDSVGPVFCALSRSEELRRPGAWRAHSSQTGSASYHLPGPSHSVSWVHSRSTVSGVPCVSSGELISDCDPPGRCQPSRVPRRRLATGSLLAVW